MIIFFFARRRYTTAIVTTTIVAIEINQILVGEIAAFYAMWYSLGRYFVEGMRTDSLMLTETIRMAQFISIATIVVVTIAVVYRRLAKKNMITYRKRPQFLQLIFDLIYVK